MDNSNLEESEASLRTAELTPRQVKLLLEYGYPFSDQEQILRNSRAVKGYHHVRLGEYWIELMIGDLVRSAKEIRSTSLLEEIDELCDVLEFALNDRPNY